MTLVSRLDELQTFKNELVQYINSVTIYLKDGLTKKERKRGSQIYSTISNKIGYLGSFISELSRIENVDVNGKEYDMWLAALKMPTDKLAESALGVCLLATNKAIGKLTDDINRVVRDEQGNLIEKPRRIVSEPPKAFIAHGGRSGILDKLREFIEALGMKPIIVELSPTKGMTVDEKVNKYIKDADCGIVLATKGGIVDSKGKEPKKHPRLNVIDELERLRAAFPEKTMLLLERGVDLPSNISGLTYEPFVGQSMDRAFTAIARELTEFGILKAVKPLAEEHKP